MCLTKNKIRTKFSQHSTAIYVAFCSLKFLSNLNFYPCVRNKFFAFLLTLTMAVGLFSGTAHVDSYDYQEATDEEATGGNLHKGDGSVSDGNGTTVL